VLYELVSGRIPYEGPDTKTTNGYVIAGMAQPPSKHDPSIPEPIVKVIMTALEGNAERRYKDGGELEAALREAWDRCLTQSLVHPSILAMDEVPHDKAPALMHAQRGGPGGSPRPAPKAELTQQETLEITSSRDGRFDDEQTTILKRDDLRPPNKSAVRNTAQMAGAAPPPPPPASNRESRPVMTQHGAGGSGPLILPGPPAQHSPLPAPPPMALPRPAPLTPVPPLAATPPVSTSPVVPAKAPGKPVAPPRGTPWAMIIMLLLLGIFSTIAILHFLGVIHLNELL